MSCAHCACPGSTYRSESRVGEIGGWIGPGTRCVELEGRGSEGFQRVRMPGSTSLGSEHHPGPLQVLLAPVPQCQRGLRNPRGLGLGCGVVAEHSTPCHLELYCFIVIDLRIRAKGLALTDFHDLTVVVQKPRRVGELLGMAPALRQNPRIFQKPARGSGAEPIGGGGFYGTVLEVRS